MRKSVEDIEIIRIHLTRLIEQAIIFQDALISYQMEVYDPILKEPFCVSCGEPIEARQWNGKPWKCDDCKREQINKKERDKRAKTRPTPQSEVGGQ